MKIIIFGGSGFIGKNLIKNLVYSYPILQLSLRKETWIDDLEGADVFLNFIGKAHDHEKIASEQDYYYANVELTKQIFDAFISNNAKLLIHISSLAAIEEFESELPLTEENSCHPISWYGKSKRVAEEWLLNQNIPEGKKLIIIRPPMVHGPGDKGNLGLLYKLISKGIPYPLASFNNKRSFISIDNFVYFMDQIIRNQNKLNSGIYNIADDESISTTAIINIIKEVTGKKVPNLSLPRFFVKSIAKIGDFLPIPLDTKRLKKMTSNLLVSNKKIKTALGIEKLPLTAIEGLQKTILSFKKL